MTEHEDQRAQERREQRQHDGRETAEATPAEKADDEGQEGGQVSEVQSLTTAGEPIVDDQSVAGSPDPDVDEGPTGPNSRAGSDRN
jgi:hypothetical protein